MKPHLRSLMAAGALLAGCTASSPPAQWQEDSDDGSLLQLPANVSLRRIAPDVWVHVTEDAEGVKANGMLLVGETSSILIDTGWTEAQTRSLMRWAAEEQFRPIETAVVTHSHQDRMGGIRVLREASVTVVAGSFTAERARARMLPEPTEVFDGVRQLGEIELFFPGAAHAPDNIVVWLPRQQLLFGGCAIKSGEATQLNLVEGSSLEGWYHAIHKLQDRYPSPRLILPGHGRPGGPELYKHNLQLIAAKGGRS